MTLASGHTSFAARADLRADGIVGVMQEMPTRVGSKESKSALNFSWFTSLTAQSIILTSKSSCSSTAAMYAKPRGGKSG